MDLSALLGHGRENAVSSDFLAAQLQTSTRGLRDKILKARCNGEIILYAPGGHGGYFLPSDDPETAQKEMAAFYNVQSARCKHGLLAIAPVARRLGMPLGQTDLESYLCAESLQSLLTNSPIGVLAQLTAQSLFLFKWVPR